MSGCSDREQGWVESVGEEILNLLQHMPNAGFAGAFASSKRLPGVETQVPSVIGCKFHGQIMDGFGLGPTGKPGLKPSGTKCNQKRDEIHPSKSKRGRVGL